MLDLAPGTRVMLEGPYGAFTADIVKGDRAVLLAGGIGITPLRAIIDELPRDVRTTLLVRARSWGDVAFQGELAAIAQQRGIDIRYLVGKRGSAQMPVDPLAPTWWSAWSRTSPPRTCSCAGLRPTRSASCPACARSACRPPRSTLNASEPDMTTPLILASRPAPRPPDDASRRASRSAAPSASASRRPAWRSCLATTTGHGRRLRAGPGRRDHRRRERGDGRRAAGQPDRHRLGQPGRVGHRLRHPVRVHRPRRLRQPDRERVGHHQRRLRDRERLAGGHSRRGRHARRSPRPRRPPGLTGTATGDAVSFRFGTVQVQVTVENGSSRRSQRSSCPTATGGRPTSAARWSRGSRRRRSPPSRRTSTSSPAPPTPAARTPSRCSRPSIGWPRDGRARGLDAHPPRAAGHRRGRRPPSATPSAAARSG